MAKWDNAADVAQYGGPLAGYKIIDLTTMISGPLATMMLGDQGADVIKLEAPGTGDHVRSGGHRSGGLAATFLNNNRNKRSLALDLKKPEGRDILLRLAEDADVFIQNFRPGVVERLGVGEADIRAVKSDIVYVSLSGFGENGPYATKPVYDPIIQAASGLASVQGGSDQNQPRLIRTILPDKLTAVTAAQAITAALLARERDGIGQHVRLSMLDAVMAFLWSSDMGGQTFVDKPVSVQRAASFIDLIYATQDGHISVAVMSDKEWHALIRAVEHPEWLDDLRFTTPALRDKNIEARLSLTQEALRTRTSAEWIKRLEAEGVPCAPVLTCSWAMLLWRASTPTLDAFDRHVLLHASMPHRQVSAAAHRSLVSSPTRSSTRLDLALRRSPRSVPPALSLVNSAP